MTSDRPENPFELVHTPYVPLTDEDGRCKSPIQPYPPLLNPCRLCPARCCFTAVKVTLPDVLHYCRTLEVPLRSGFELEVSSDVVRGFLVDPGDGDARGRRSEDGSGPEDRQQDAGRTERVELQLKRRSLELGLGCVNLVDLDGYLRCGTYEARPLSCRLYPASWRDAFGSGGPKAVLCPAPFALTPSVGERVAEDAAAARRNWEIHERLVAQWNRDHPKGAELTFALRTLLEGTAEALGVDLPGVVLDPAPPDQRLTEALVERGLIRRPGLSVIPSE